MTIDLMGEAPAVAEEAPADGELPIGAGIEWYTVPALTGGVRRTECRDLYRRWCDTAPAGPGFRQYAEVMAGLPDA